MGKENENFFFEEAKLSRKAEVRSVGHRKSRTEENGKFERISQGKTKEKCLQDTPCRHEIQKIFKVSLPSRIFSTGADLL